MSIAEVAAAGNRSQMMLDEVKVPGGEIYPGRHNYGQLFVHGWKPQPGEHRVLINGEKYNARTAPFETWDGMVSRFDVERA